MTAMNVKVDGDNAIEISTIELLLNYILYILLTPSYNTALKWDNPFLKYFHLHL